MSCSFWKLKTWVPMMGAQVLSVNTFRMKGWLSSVSWHKFAIWMIESFSGVGNLPFSEMHSMSKDRILSGAIF
jgi:hypothetical protein